MLSGRFTIYSKIGNLVMYKRPKYIYIYKASKNRVETVYKNIPILFLLSCSFTTSHPLHQGSHFLRQTQGLAEPTAANYPPSSPLWPPRWWGKDLASDNSTGAKTRDKRFLSGRWGGGFAVVRRDNNPPPRFSRVNSGKHDSFTPSHPERNFQSVQDLQCCLESIDIFLLADISPPPSKWRNYREMNGVGVAISWNENCETETGWRCVKSLMRGSFEEEKRSGKKIMRLGRWFRFLLLGRRGGAV